MSSLPLAPAPNQAVVLVVDDDDAVLHSLKFALEVEGFRVLVFTTAEALLALAPLPPSSCLVIDQNLPGKSGLELIAELRRRGDRYPAILITSHPPVGLRRRAAAAGVAIVEKPLLGDSLRDAISRALD